MPRRHLLDRFETLDLTAMRLRAGEGWKALARRYGVSEKTARRAFERAISEEMAVLTAILTRSAGEKSFALRPMAQIFSSPKQPQVIQPVAQVPNETDPAIEEARRNALSVVRRQQGRGATIVTGGQGVQDPVTVQRKRLLGGTA